jgi:hypothetical protein
MTQDELKSLLHYDADTGIFTRLTTTNNKHRIGDIAGSLDAGYIRTKLNGKTYRAHRLAWLYVYGYEPTNLIDHIDRDTANNRIANLREATSAENQQNRKKQNNNSSGFTGVSLVKKTNRWASHIKVNYKKHFLGSFTTPEEAHQAYLKAKAELHIFNPS